MSTRSLRYNTLNRHVPKSRLASTDRDALAFLEAATIYNENQQRAIIELVRRLKAAGLWSKMKAIYPFIGGTASSHKWNLKDPRDVDAAFRLSFNGGITHDANGANPNGTNAWADTFVVPATHLTADSTHISYYTRENDTGNDQQGTINTSTLHGFILMVYWGDSVMGIDSIQYNLASGTRVQGASANPQGLTVGTRTDSTTHKAFRRGVQVGTTKTDASSGFANLTSSISFFARNDDGTSRVLYSTKQCSFASIGDGLADTDVTNLHTIVDLYQKRLSRAV